MHRPARSSTFLRDKVASREPRRRARRRRCRRHGQPAGRLERARRRARGASWRSASRAWPADPEARVVVLTGAGEKAFVAGADIKYMLDSTCSRPRRWGELGQRCANLLETMREADDRCPQRLRARRWLRAGARLRRPLRGRRRPKLGQPEINLGIIPGWGGTQRLSRVAGLGVAKELVLTGRMVDAEEALRLGLVNAVYEPDELLERDARGGPLLAAKSAVALAYAKQARNAAVRRPQRARLQTEERLFAVLFATRDQTEGMTRVRREARAALHRQLAEAPLRLRLAVTTTRSTASAPFLAGQGVERGGAARSRRRPTCRLRKLDMLVAEIRAAASTPFTTGCTIAPRETFSSAFAHVRHPHAARPGPQAGDAHSDGAGRRERDGAAQGQAEGLARADGEEQVQAGVRSAKGLVASPSFGCTSKCRCVGPPSASPESPT